MNYIKKTMRKHGINAAAAATIAYSILRVSSGCMEYKGVYRKKTAV
jgi:hypothetical protein